MQIRVTAKPHMLLETVELLFAYVNGVAPEELTCPGEFCLPVQAVREMMDLACAHIPRDDPQMTYYFGSYLLSREPRTETCIARNMTYDLPFLSEGSVAGDCRTLRRLRRELGEHNSIVSVGEYYLNWVGDTEGPVVPVIEGIGRLEVSQDYSRKLQEQFLDHDLAIGRLEALLAPVAARLEPLLLPWAQRAEPLAQHWRDLLQDPDTCDAILKRINFDQTEGLQAQWVQLRYLRPQAGPGNYDLHNGTLFAHMGVALYREPESQLIDRAQMEALRLLGSESRLRMLRLMLDTPMSTRELAQRLQINLGTVARDVRNMFEAKLLLVEPRNNRVFYRTNARMLQLLGQRIADLRKHFQN